MPRKGMRSLCFVSKTPSLSIYRDSASNSPSRSIASLQTPRRISFSESVIQQRIETAEAIIMKWNPDTSTFAKVTSLFYESKEEASQFMKCVYDLQKTMHLLISEDSTAQKLIQAQNLMQIAMKRLQKEFYQILSMNRAQLDPESVSTRSSRTSARSSMSDFDDDDDNDEIRAAGDSITEVEETSTIAMSDLRSIAECMIGSGYAKECVNIYKMIRKSIVDEGIYRLGVEKITASRMNKMEWEVLDSKIKNWLEAVKISIKTLFTGERILCDHVFASSDSIRESCFADISKEGATLMFAFPELVVATGAKIKKPSPPEKIYRVLDMYTAIAENWKEIESIFSFESTSTVRSQAVTSLIRLGDSSRSMIADFESSIEKDSSKVLISGGVHPLTISSMNYLSLLADYSNVLTDIVADWSPPEKSPLPTFYFEISDSEDSPAPAISLRISWIVLVILCKLDGKAKQYKDISLSYLFLANNLQHVVSRVRTSNLQYLLGKDWIEKHEAKVRQFAAKYERLAWDPVYASLPDDPTASISQGQAKDRFKRFNGTFEEAYRKQRSLIVSDLKLRDEIKVSITRKIVPAYREFHNTHRSTVVGERDVRSVGLIVRFTPEDVGNKLSDLFFGTTESGDSSASSSTSSSSSNRRHSRSTLRSYIQF